MLSLGNNLSKKTGIVAPGVVRDNLVMEHKYPTGAAQPLSDGAAYFDGINSGIQLADPFNNQTFTVSAWVYRIDDGNTHAIFSARDNSTDGFVLFISDDEYVRAKVNSTTTDEVAGTLITANTWNHVVAMVTDNSKIELYVNGVFGDDKALSGSVANATNARIGLNNYDSGNDYEGYICNVGYWNRILTQAEIKSIMWKNYAGLSDTEKSSLVSWWNLGDAVNVALNSLDSLSGSNELANSSLSVSDVAVHGANSISVGTIASLEANEIKVTYINNDDGVKISLSSSNGGVFTSNLVVNTVYQLKLKAKINSGNANLRLYDGSNTYILDNISNTEYQEYTYNFAAKNATSAYINQEALGSGQIFYIKDISLKAYPGDSPHGVLS